ncbi:hypothetical protein [Corynebacterium capitovis]|uniref:hypothetical protein n=1 Tax=Corynebacterium capitovis TaxID=131081 RepID=UPI000375AC81|nr:hypothetical protein [Corynebacterium capitovis]
MSYVVSFLPKLLAGIFASSVLLPPSVPDVDPGFGVASHDDADQCVIGASQDHEFASCTFGELSSN